MTRLVHISDLHFGAHRDGLVDAFIDFAHDLRPDIVVASGDFTQGGRRSEFAQASRFLQWLPCPTVIAPGNHDAPAWALHRRLLSPWSRLRHYVGAVTSTSWRDDVTYVDTFSTSPSAQLRLDWSLGRVKGRSLAEALSRTNTRSANRVSVLSCHHPLVAPNTSGRRAATRGGSEAADRITEQAQLVLTGHLHQAFALNRSTDDGRSCWFIGASTTFSTRTRKEPAGFNLLEIADDAAVLTTFKATDADRYAREGMQTLSFNGGGRKSFVGPELRSTISVV